MLRMIPLPRFRAEDKTRSQRFNETSGGRLAPHGANAAASAKATGNMAHSLLTPTMIARESLRVLHQKLRFIGSINRQYDDRFAQSGAKIGDALRIRLPAEFSIRTGKALDVQDISEEYVTLDVTEQVGVDMAFSSAELTLTIDDFGKRYIEPAMAKLAAHLEAEALAMYKDVYEEISDDSDTLSLADVLEGAPSC